MIPLARQQQRVRHVAQTLLRTAAWRHCMCTAASPQSSSPGSQPSGSDATTLNDLGVMAQEIQATLESLVEMVGELVEEQEEILATNKSLVRTARELVEGQEEILATNKCLVRTVRELREGQEEILATQESLVRTAGGLMEGQAAILDRQTARDKTLE